MFWLLTGTLAVMVGLALFGMICLRWGYDSSERSDSLEWERRQYWRGWSHGARQEGRWN